MRSRSGEGTSSQPIFTAQPPPMPNIPFNPPIMGANRMLPESQHATRFSSAQPT